MWKWGNGFLCTRNLCFIIMTQNVSFQSSLLHIKSSTAQQKLLLRITSHLLCLSLRFQSQFYKICVPNHHNLPVNAILLPAACKSHTDITVHIQEKITDLYNGSSSIQLPRTRRNLAPVSSIQLFPSNFQYSLHSLQCFCITTVRCGSVNITRDTNT
jgi:hypothetical protein